MSKGMSTFSMKNIKPNNKNRKVITDEAYIAPQVLNTRLDYIEKDLNCVKGDMNKLRTEYNDINDKINDAMNKAKDDSIEYTDKQTYTDRWIFGTILAIVALAIAYLQHINT